MNLYKFMNSFILNIFSTSGRDNQLKVQINRKEDVIRKEDAVLESYHREEN